jgi:spore coat polysaccharide biosynthesis protein SpsF
MPGAVGIVLQARFASMRLPGKAMATLGSYSIVEHCLRRLMAGGAGQVVLATTTGREDDVLVAIARRLGAGVVRGSRHDVLGRYVQAADAFGFEWIVRATGDNPAVDMQAPGRLLAAARGAGADYACERGLPVGGGVEVVAADVLRGVARAAHEPGDREHVTTWITRHRQVCHIAEPDAPATLYRPDLRVTVDTAEDLARMRALFLAAGGQEPSLPALILAAGPAGTETMAAGRRAG